MADVDTVQNYAYQMADSLLDDYKSKTAKWKPALRNVGSAFEGAWMTHRSTVKAAEAELAAQDALAWSALSLVCGFSLGWVKAAVAPRMAQTFDKAMREAIAGRIEDSVKWGAGELLKKGQAATKISFSAHALKSSPLRFQNNLLNTYDKNRQKVIDEITLLKDSIHRDPGWGAHFLQLGGGSVAGAKKKIDQWETVLKRDWLNQTHYYKNRPSFPTLIAMQRIIETEMWSEWIKKAMKPKSQRVVYHGGNVVSGGTQYPRIGDTVEKRLVELRIMQAPTNWYGSRAPARAALQKTLKKRGVEWDPKHKPPVRNLGGDSLGHWDKAALQMWASKHPVQYLGGKPKPAAAH